MLITILSTLSVAHPMTQTMIEQLTPEEYSFFLAYGVIDDDTLQLQEMIDKYIHTEE